MSFLGKIHIVFNNVVTAAKSSDYGPKVFCIGYNKTGTTTLGKSLELLGYRNTSFNGKIFKLYKEKEYSKILKYMSKFDSADDLPWLAEDMIPRLDQTFANSKFVYLVRDEESWKRSFKNWRKKVFGDEPDVNLAWEGYKNHEKFVLNYFKERTSREFVVLDIKDPEGFNKLASFLEKKAPQNDFPHFNKTHAD